MTDVARLAGVSHQTVSRVINGSRRVAPETRQRVSEAMRVLDYRPNSAARALVTGRSRMVGVICSDTTLYGPGSTLFGMAQAAYAAEYLTCVVSIPQLTRESLLLAVERLRRHGVEGVLAVAQQIEAIGALAHVPPGVPLVAVEAGPEEGVATVAIDQYGGAVTATRHLLDLGHRNVTHVAGPGHWQETQVRTAGWRDTLRAAGIQPPEPLSGDWSPGSGYGIGSRIARMDDVTAIFAANDQMALGVLRALHEVGRRVPEEVSIVGFDAIPEGAYFNPPLTTIRQDFVEIGRRGFELVRRQIEAGDREVTRAVVPTELILRASTAPPPS